MAPVPKRKVSRARQGKRRAAIRLRLPQLVACSHCKAQIYPHTVCNQCGYYRGKEIIPNENRV